MKRLNANNNLPYKADESVPLENLLDYNELIEKGRYILHPTGGAHFFANVEHALDKYKVFEYPWIEDTKPCPTGKGMKKNINDVRKATIVGPCSGSDYATFRIFKEFPDSLTPTEALVYRFGRPIHRAVAAAYCYNPDFSKNPITNHINFDKQDYRICNLEWTTYAKNSVGSYERKEASEVYDNYMEKNSRVSHKFNI